MSLATKVKQSLRDGALHRWVQYRRGRRALSDWQNAGIPLPPPQAFKHSVIRSAAKRWRIKAFVETGTFHGDTVAACLDDFKELHSIELAEHLFSAARNRFSGKEKVRLYFGDSAKQLERVLSTIKEPALFWLDAHFSGGDTARASIDTPIVRELELISEHLIKGHVILIDDVREFNGNNGYPTREKLCDMVHQILPNHQVSIDVDIMLVEPAQSLGSV
jgi:hypothetical protein